MFSLFFILFISSVRAESFMPGDVILLPLSCYLCKAIEIETDSPWSHVGIVLKDEDKGNDGRLFVAHADGKVVRESIQKFIDMSTPGKKPAFFRSRTVAHLCQNKHSCDEFSKQLFERFRSHFEGLLYDHDFLWDNVDESGNEKLYCSEFVAKLLSPFIPGGLPPRPLSYKRAPEFWLDYFKGNVPEGVPGNAPADFARSSEFKSIFVN